MDMSAEKDGEDEHSADELEDDEEEETEADRAFIAPEGDVEEEVPSKPKRRLKRTVDDDDDNDEKETMATKPKRSKDADVVAPKKRAKKVVTAAAQEDEILVDDKRANFNALIASSTLKALVDVMKQDKASIINVLVRKEGLEFITFLFDYTVYVEAHLKADTFESYTHHKDALLVFNTLGLTKKFSQLKAFAANQVLLTGYEDKIKLSGKSKSSPTATMTGLTEDDNTFERQDTSNLPPCIATLVLDTKELVTAISHMIGSTFTFELDATHKRINLSSEEDSDTFGVRIVLSEEDAEKVKNIKFSSIYNKSHFEPLARGASLNSNVRLSLPVDPASPLRVDMSIGDESTIVMWIAGR